MGKSVKSLARLTAGVVTMGASELALKQGAKMGLDPLGVGKKGEGAVPLPPGPKVAPTPDDDAAAAATQRKVSRKYAKAGRAGTMLTEGSTLG